MHSTPSLRSASAPPRASLMRLGGGVPSEANLSVLRSRLRQSGAIVSSHSIASRVDANLEVEVVDVGVGREPTPVEHLLARLEQHGLRRRLAADDDGSAYEVEVAVRAAEEKEAAEAERSGTAEEDTAADRSSHAASSGAARSRGASLLRSDNPDTREPYYYLCVPCELRLTVISSRAPLWRALEDVHYHFSSAAHRAAASWMADDDIDKALHASPLVAPPSQYSRIFVNGIPMLLSRRPGGGDMFFPLPHEVERVRPAAHSAATSRAPSVRSTMASVDRDASYPLYPSSALRGENGGRAALWQRALPTCYTTKIQLLRRVDDRHLYQPEFLHQTQTSSKKEGYRKLKINERTTARSLVDVEHIDPAAYCANTRLPHHLLPLVPAILPIHRTRVAKALLVRKPRVRASLQRGNGDTERAAVYVSDPHRVVYTQAYEPLAEGWQSIHTQGGGPKTEAAPVPLTVFEEQAYRVALLSADDQRQRTARAAASARSSRRSSVSRMDSEQNAATTAVLTREALTQHTNATSQSWRSTAGSGVGASMASSRVSVSNSRPSSRMSSESTSHESEPEVSTRRP